MRKYTQILTSGLPLLIFSCFSFGQGMIIKSGSNIIKSSGNVILSRNLVNDGTFTDSGGTLAFNGTTQSVGGSSTAIFKNITVSSGSTTTWTKGFNLVGNSYPSPIDWNSVSGWTKTNIDDALYYFKASTTDQYGGTYSTLIAGFSSDGVASNIIPSMQGFLVHVSDGAFPVTGVLQMDNNTRVTDQSQPFIKGENILQLQFYNWLNIVSTVGSFSRGQFSGVQVD